MGYRARRADNVYDYVFRLGEHASRTLSDGFGWSILFVNDNSDECRDFLQRYGAELCYRTADRIRFVFFSGLNNWETNELERAGRRGLLSRIIAATVSWTSDRRQYDWEHDAWKRLRPEPFQPLNSQEQIQHSLSEECERHTAMPGSREALQFAQRLGIGRFVPCFLMFADVGSPVLRVLPFRGLRPEQVFARLRQWTDSFYEVNGEALEQWKRLETEVEQECVRLRSSVDKVEQWRRSRAENWTLLKSLSHCLRRLEHAPPGGSSLRDMGHDWSLPARLREAIAPHLSELEPLQLQATSADEVSAIVDGLLRGNQSETHVLRELTAISEVHGKNLPAGLKAAIDAGRKLFDKAVIPPSPERELRDWWQSEHGHPPFRNQHDQQRRAWSHYSIAKHGQQAVGKVGEIVAREFAAVRGAILAQSITVAPERAADAAITALAVHLGISPELDTWKATTTSYHAFLSNYVAQLRAHVPRWLLDLANSSSPMTWADSMPAMEQRRQGRFLDQLAGLPLLEGLLQQVMAVRGAQEHTMSEQRASEQTRILGHLAEQTRSWCTSALPNHASIDTVWRGAISELSRMRDEVEAQVFEAGKRTTHASFPGEKLSRSDATQLMRVLDSYESAISSLYLPYDRDPNVLKVAMDRSPIDALELRRPYSHAALVEPVRHRMQKAVRDCEASVERWPSLKREGATWNPGGSLCSALSQVASKERLDGLLAKFGVQSVENAPEALPDRRRMLRFLDELDVHELLGVERTLGGTTQSDKTAASKQELHNSILTAIGLFPGTDDVAPTAPSADRPIAERLRDKIARGAFDIFLAHNSKDKPSVRQLGQALRARGIYPWIDVEQIPPGRWYQDVIQSAVRTVRTAAIVLGASGLGKWQAAEIRAFTRRCVEHDVPVVPVLLPGTSSIPDELEFLRDAHFVAFAHNVNEPDAITRLVWAVTGENPNAGLDVVS